MKLALFWIGAGILGTAITYIRNVDEMKEKEPFVLFVGIIACIGAGPLTLIASFKPDIFG